MQFEQCRFSENYLNGSKSKAVQVCGSPRVSQTKSYIATIERTLSVNIYFFFSLHQIIPLQN